MQVSLFSVAPGDSRALDELNRCLRGHRVLTLDRHCDAGVWSFCVTWQPGTAEALPAEKVDYKALLDAPTFALFAKLRDVRRAGGKRKPAGLCGVYQRTARGSGAAAVRGGGGPREDRRDRDGAGGEIRGRSGGGDQ